MFKRMALATFALVLLTSIAYADKAAIFSTKDGAIRGYDPVAYFTESKPVKGKAAYTTEWKGATWYFASAGNRDTFKAEPAKYAPQYGGYCAYAVSRGYTASTEPNAWAVVDGKLYLNYNLDVAKAWRKDTRGNITKADKNWPGVLTKK